MNLRSRRVCPESKRPTPAALLTLRRLRNSARPERKETARVKTF